MTQNGVQPRLAALGDVGDQDCDPADLPAAKKGSPVPSLRRQNPRVGDVDVLADEVHVGFAGASTFFTSVRFAVRPTRSPGRCHLR